MAMAIAGAFPRLPVVHHAPVLDIAERRRKAAGFKRKFRKRKIDARSARADARCLGRWFGCLFVEAREGKLYRCRCLCGAEKRIEPKRLTATRSACAWRCPLRRKAAA